MLLRISNFLTRLIDKNKILQKTTQTKRDGAFERFPETFSNFRENHVEIRSITDISAQ